jgi:hypothetical protein
VISCDLQCFRGELRLRFSVQLLLTVVGSTCLFAGFTVITGGADTVVGKTVVARGDSVSDLAGSRVPLIARDSFTLIVFVDALCAACRLHVREQVSWAAVRQSEGVAVRILLRNNARRTRQFARLAGNSRFLEISDSSTFDAFHVTTVPSAALVAPSGKVAQQWIWWEKEIDARSAAAGRLVSARPPQP